MSNKSNQLFDRKKIVFSNPENGRNKRKILLSKYDTLLFSVPFVKL